MRQIAIISALTAVLAASGCGAPTGGSTPAETGKVWRLNTVDNMPFNGGEITMSLSKDGKQISGQGPCSAFSGDIVNKHYPAVRIVNIQSSDTTCALSGKEHDFLQALGAVTGQISRDDIVVFTSTSGRRLEFVPVAG